MGKIVLLDELTINQIAAGEVIERPASVVKELVENSIDAGAKNITVEIKNGGISYIRVTDDGSGILPDDMEIAFERHATSKIRKVDDLDTVKSMGFRGEALASIASIATVEMVSKTEESDIGYKIVVQGGEIEDKHEEGAQKGTSITVKELFYNTPVRYKFLKKDFTESGYIEDVLTRIALANPSVSIKLINSGKTIVQTNGNGKLEDCVYDIFGKEVAQNIIPVDYLYEDMHVSGVIGKPIISRSNRTNQIFFVNKRYVKDKVLSSATEQAFKGLVTVGKHAFVILNIDMDANKVDVNVHPTKLEIRFQDESSVFKAMFHAIKETLLKSDLISDPVKDYTDVTPNDILKGIKNQERKDAWSIIKKEDNIEDQKEESIEEEKKEEEDNQKPSESLIERKLLEIKNRIEAMAKAKEENKKETSIGVGEESIEYKDESKEESKESPLYKIGIDELKENKRESIFIFNDNDENDINEKENIDEVSNETKINEIDEAEKEKEEIEETSNEVEKEELDNNSNDIEKDDNQEEIDKEQEAKDELGETKIVTVEEIKQEVENSDLNDEIKKEIADRVKAIEEEEPVQDFEEMYKKLFGRDIETAKKEFEEKEKEEEKYSLMSPISNNEMSLFEDGEDNLPPFNYIGIAFKTYIILTLNDELFLLDQHAAHERIMYEKVKTNYYNDDEKDSQLLLLPDVINLNNREMGIFLDNKELFEKAGFVVDEFGKNTVKLSGVPEFILNMNTKEIFLETLDEIDTVARTAKQELEEKFLATVACKAAVKANMALRKEEVESLMKQLLKLPNPFSCPHGRPTVIKMSKNDIEKKFSRIQ